ncbi:MAG: hypothetical protein FWD94_06805 [Treponema sp.]|nr:hypothetical protein [Treponema sp.]
MTIERIVEIDADRRLYLEVPPDWPTGKVRVALTLISRQEPRDSATDKWVNPLLGLAKAKGAKLTLDRFMEMQRAEVEMEIENDRYLWGDK